MVGFSPQVNLSGNIFIDISDTGSFHGNSEPSQRKNIHHTSLTQYLHEGVPLGSRFYRKAFVSEKQFRLID